MIDKLNPPAGGHKLKTFGGILGILIFAGAVFGVYKFGQKQARPVLPPPPGSEAPGVQGEKVFCKDPRPQICTLEMIIPPPYICGSDGKPYGNKCQACANPKVEWYRLQETPCEGE